MQIVGASVEGLGEYRCSVLFQVGLSAPIGVGGRYSCCVSVAGSFGHPFWCGRWYPGAPVVPGGFWTPRLMWLTGGSMSVVSAGALLSFCQ